MESNIWFAFALTILAGLATGIGSVLAFFTKKDNTKFQISFCCMAREYGQAHMAIYGLLAGMLVMAVSLLLFM